MPELDCTKMKTGTKGLRFATKFSNRQPGLLSVRGTFATKELRSYAHMAYCQVSSPFVAESSPGFWFGISFIRA